MVQKRREGNTDPLDLVFLLPNKEFKYYLDDEGSFNQFIADVRNMLLLQQDFTFRGQINVTFVPFLWGDGENNRPYLSKEPKVKPARLAELALRKL